MSESDLKVLEVAKFCGCCSNTVLNYSAKAIINCTRDINGRRRYTLAEADKLKQILSARWPEQAKDESHNT